MEEVPRELVSMRRDMGCLETGQSNPVVQSSVTCYWVAVLAGSRLHIRVSTSLGSHPHSTFVKPRLTLDLILSPLLFLLGCASNADFKNQIQMPCLALSTAAQKRWFCIMSVANIAASGDSLRPRRNLWHSLSLICVCL